MQPNQPPREQRAPDPAREEAKRVERERQKQREKEKEKEKQARAEREKVKEKESQKRKHEEERARNKRLDSIPAASDQSFAKRLASDRFLAPFVFDNALPPVPIDPKLLSLTFNKVGGWVGHWGIGHWGFGWIRL